MFHRNKLILLFMVSLPATVHFAAYSDPAQPTSDMRIIASKAYVDTKQGMISATTNTYTYDETNRPTADGSVVTTTTTAGTTGQRGIATAPVSDGNGGYSNGNWLPTVGAMMNAINAHTPTGTQNTIANYGANGALGSGIATYDGSGTYAPATDAGKIATAAAVETKQDKITTEMVEFNGDPELMLPAITTYDSTSGLVANKIGILDLETVGADEGDLSLYTYDEGGYGAEMDNFVPTVRLIAESFQRLYWNTDTHLAAVNAYSTEFNGGTNNWPTNNSNQLVTGFDFASGLALKQNKIAKSGYYYTLSGTLTAYGNDSNTNGWLHAGVKGTGLVTKTATDGVVGERKIFEATDVANYHAGTLTQVQKDIQDISIPTVGAMMTAISNGANAALPTGTTGTVVTYNGVTNGVRQFSEKAIYDTANAYNATNDAGKLATAGFVETKQNKIAAGTSGNVVTYTGTAGSVGSATVSSAATYNNGTLQNGSDIANITAVETKVSKTQSTGYQVLTTGTSGTVTPDYLAVPVTTSGSGRPTNNNTPTSAAAIWIE